MENLEKGLRVRRVSAQVRNVEFGIWKKRKIWNEDKLDQIIDYNLISTNLRSTESRKKEDFTKHVVQTQHDQNFIFRTQL